MLKVLHTADWHLGNFPAPASKSRTNLRYLDICAYIEYLIAKAKELDPDIIIIAGDVFHQAKTWSDRGLQETNAIVGYINQLSAIAPVCVLRGTPNHDGKMHYNLLSTALHDNDRVYIIDEPCVKNINNLAAVTFVPIFDKTTQRMESDVPMDKEAENNYFSDKVRDAILDLKKEADAYNLPTILVTHYTVLGSIMPNGRTNIFATNEVVIDPVTLIQSDYWLTCLGHIHKPQKIDSCPNTFYSGSLCALTFNDERDPHGFYMHYITDHDNVTSEFIEIPSRKFHTLQLDDAQLSAIIASDYNVEPYIGVPMTGDIVRAIYTCSDVTNKALNKALLEKALYAATEAFYVQEIVPEDINITVDKTAMRNTASIGDNLSAFLKNEQSEYGSISDVQIQDCLNLAQPIIDRLLASKKTNYNIGTFTPIEIEVKNYRNYKNAVFNYNDVRFCVINGDNGAGKSSLFMDAMLDALYEETREGDITGWITNDVNVRSGSIKFTFSIGDNVYKVTRTRQKSGKATLSLAQFVTDSNGNRNWVDMSEEKLKDTQAAIEKVVGMNAMTLKSCGLIMQDAYGLFLQADKNTRMDILGDILSLNIYDELAAAASDFGTTCQRELNKITDDENNITANLKDGNAIQMNLNEATANGATYNRQLTDCSNDLLICTIKRENLVKDSDSYNRLTTDITSLNSKRQQLSVAMEQQNTILADAYAIASEERTYSEKVKRYNELVEKEKSLSEKIALNKTLLDKKNQFASDIQLAENTIRDAETKLDSAEQLKKTVETELSSADDINAKAALYDKVKREIAGLEIRRNEITALETELAEKDTQISENNHAMTNLKIEYDAKFNEINHKIQILNESGCPIAEKATCKFLADAQQALADKPIVTDEYNTKLCDFIQKSEKLKAERSVIEDKIGALSIGMPDIEAKKKELSLYEDSALKASSIPLLKQQLETCENQITEYSKLRDDTTVKLTDLKTQLNDTIAQISALTEDISGYDAVISELKSIGDIAAQGNEIAAAKATMTAANKRIEELVQEIRLIDGDISTKTDERNAINVDTAAIAKIDADILACRTSQDLLNKNIADNNRVIGRLELELKQYQSDIRQLSKLKQLKDKSAYVASNAGWLKKAFSKSGIPHNIIRSIIPVLQTTASNILGQMSNNTMSIELKTEKMLTTKKEVATLDIIVCDTVTGDLPYLSRSGGERVKAALSIVLALAEIKSSESGTQLGFLFIDEPPFLDSNGIDAYCDALEAIQQRYSNLKIIAITHDPEMKSRFTQSIDVVKTPNGSEIYTNL